MGNSRKPRKHLRRGQSSVIEPGPGEAWCTQLAIVPDRTSRALIDLAMRETHDRLVAGLSFRRRSGVRWTHHDAAEAGHFVRTTQSPSPERDEMLERLSDPMSLLVVAWAVGALPEGATFGTWDPTNPDENAAMEAGRLVFVPSEDGDA